MAHDDEDDERPWEWDSHEHVHRLVPSKQASAKMRTFLTRVADGIGLYNAGAEVGWSPRVVDDKMRDADVLEMVRDAQTMTIEDIEAAVIRRAKRGNVQAAAMVLYSQAADRGWRPPQTRVAISTVSKVQVEVVEAARQTVTALLESHDVKALQIGGALDAIDATCD